MDIPELESLIEARIKNIEKRNKSIEMARQMEREARRG